jgi:hypothetical protein
VSVQTRSALSDEHGSFILEFAVGSWVYFLTLIFFCWALFFIFEQAALQFAMDQTLRTVAISGLSSSGASDEVQELTDKISDVARNFHVDMASITVTAQGYDNGSGNWQDGIGADASWVRVRVEANRLIPILRLTIPFSTGVLVRRENRPN